MGLTVAVEAREGAARRAAQQAKTLKDEAIAKTEAAKQASDLAQKQMAAAVKAAAEKKKDMETAKKAVSVVQTQINEKRRSCQQLKLTLPRRQRTRKIPKDPWTKQMQRRPRRVSAFWRPG